MKKSGVPVIAWILVGLLAISGGLLSLGEQDQNSSPEASSFSPSGISAFAELLRKQGDSVSIDQYSEPALDSNDVAIAFMIMNRPSRGVRAGQPSVDPFPGKFWDFIQNGGSGIVVNLESDFLDASRRTIANPYSTARDLTNNETFKITTGAGDLDEPFSDAAAQEGATGISLWSDEHGPFVRAYRYGTGTALVIRDGMGATNRFIDKNDNAKAFTTLVSILTHNRKHVVFTEASFGKVHDPGVLESIGAWANAAWQQLLFLGLVVVFTLGKRFGVAEVRRPVQRSSRELLDAIADSFRRARSTTAALASCSAAADLDLRRALKLPRDATRLERDRLIPVNLQNALARMDAASQFAAVTPDQALDLIVRSQNEMEAFLGPHRAKLRSLAKLKT